MKKLWMILGTLLLCSSIASAEITIDNGKFVFNGEKQDMVWGRSCFKLSNIVTYHYSGNGSGKYSLGQARRWVDFNVGLGFDACRVLLETAGWDNCESGAQANDGVPQNCMFGSEPTDQGFWHVPTLQGGSRPTEMHGIGKQTLRWFYQTSQETGMMFELVVVATLKHNDVSVQQQGHVIRQTLAEGRKLQAEFQRALIVFNLINEWNAHSEWEIQGVDGVDMLAIRADRWKNAAGQTRVSHESPGPGYEAEQCPECVVIVDGGGSNEIEYAVGSEPGKFHGAFVHPERDASWHQWPDAQEKAVMVRDARGMPWGATESMYYVEVEDFARARTWYRMAGDRTNGWTTDFGLYNMFLTHTGTAGMAYNVVHDEKGVQCDPDWPRAMTRVDQWAQENLGGVAPPPLPPPLPTQVYYDHVINAAFQKILLRDADANGLAAYNSWLRECFATPGDHKCLVILEDAVVKSDEYNLRFRR